MQGIQGAVSGAAGKEAGAGPDKAPRQRAPGKRAHETDGGLLEGKRRQAYKAAPVVKPTQSRGARSAPNAAVRLQVRTEEGIEMTETWKDLVNEGGDIDGCVCSACLALVDTTDYTVVDHDMTINAECFRCGNKIYQYVEED